LLKEKCEEKEIRTASFFELDELEKANLSRIGDKL